MLKGKSTHFLCLSPLNQWRGPQGCATEETAMFESNPFYPRVLIHLFFLSALSKLTTFDCLISYFHARACRVWIWLKLKSLPSIYLSVYFVSSGYR